MSGEDPGNDLEVPDGSGLTVEIWRNRVLGLRGPVSRLVDRVARLLGGPFHHLLLVVRFPAGPDGEREVARYEIYEPCDHPPRRGDWRRPASLGGFLQRRRSAPGQPVRTPDPTWDLHPVWIRNYPAEHALLAALAEGSLRRYRWRDHYPRWWDNLRGRHVNSNTFVEKVVEVFGLRNRDGTPIDLSSGGAFRHPGLGLTAGWEFGYDYGADTAALHAEWRRLHGRGPVGRMLSGTRLGRRWVPRRLPPEEDGPA